MQGYHFVGHGIAGFIPWYADGFERLTARVLHSWHFHNIYKESSAPSAVHAATQTDVPRARMSLTARRNSVTNAARKPNNFFVLKKF